MNFTDRLIDGYCSSKKLLGLKEFIFKYFSPKNTKETSHNREKKHIISNQPLIDKKNP
jgi:hypothetical protein